MVRKFAELEEQFKAELQVATDQAATTLEAAATRVQQETVTMRAEVEHQAETMRAELQKDLQLVRADLDPLRERFEVTEVLTHFVPGTDLLSVDR